ncbi:glutathione S-transferase family protein [Aurantimonas sp. MSK8Z-1]|uniref:glutathione S-transferase family protein n=1 Tax=Mangrovibrevibacter kandeliae TaxID=2968473 RepID=UPI002119AA05|nr:glutathione S-transferase family protein [Aurantimonas sp. MSK8Z-1]MCW4116860.1 glutathione S-transferase family protein [Aurantimonas sp. MSK8Z-1]
MITIWGMQDSGNCYKPRLLMALTGRPFRHREISTLDGSTRTEAWLAKNPAGQAPLLELGDGRLLPESNAILCFLGEGTAFVPGDPFERATMLRWMFFEQNAHEVTVAVRRSLHVYPHRRAAASEERLRLTLEGGRAALAVMERHLAAQAFFGGERPSLADIALYPYTSSAHEGGFDLGPLPAVRSWLARIEALPGYQPKSWRPQD